jgi:hypothetical protein
LGEAPVLELRVAAVLQASLTSSTLGMHVRWSRPSFCEWLQSLALLLITASLKAEHVCTHLTSGLG